MKILSRIENQGFQVNLIGESIEVTPASRLTPVQRDFLKSHKAEIIAELKDRQLTPVDKANIESWLASIGETDSTMIQDVLDQCRDDPTALQYFLTRANQSEFDTPDDRRYCHECQHLQHDGICWIAKQGKLDRASRYYKPLDICPRRCNHFMECSNEFNFDNVIAGNLND